MRKRTIRSTAAVLAAVLSSAAAPPPPSPPNLARHASAAVATETTWTTLAPEGEGFSIDVPGNPEPEWKPGHYRYAVDGWHFLVQVDSVPDTVREAVVSADRGQIRQALDTIRQGLLTSQTVRTSSGADFDGYPSLRFSTEGETDDKQPIEGK
jgi:hypothetical protein